MLLAFLLLQTEAADSGMGSQDGKGSNLMQWQDPTAKS